MGKASMCVGAVLTGLLWQLPALAAGSPSPWQLNMTPGVTDTAADVYHLHMFMFWVCCAIGAIVFGAMFYSMYKFRKSQGAVAAKFSHNTLAEVIWTVVPIVILVVMAVPATKTLYRMYDSGAHEMTVKITGYQWMWRYEYLDYRGESLGFGFVSKLDRASDNARRLGSGIDPRTLEHYLIDVDKRLILPTETKIRFVITADDVIHAWWVPALGWKQDAIPGFINEGWTKINEPGVFRGQCAELCGKDHGFMPIVVEAMPRSAFEGWLAEQRPKPVAEPAAEPDTGTPDSEPVVDTATPGDAAPSRVAQR